MTPAPYPFEGVDKVSSMAAANKILELAWIEHGPACCSGFENLVEPSPTYGYYYIPRFKSYLSFEVDSPAGINVKVGNMWRSLTKEAKLKFVDKQLQEAEECADKCRSLLYNVGFNPDYDPGEKHETAKRHNHAQEARK
jgi:hypothetical protein